MDYEKKYKQLTKLIKDLYPFMSDYCKEKIEGTIPELKESEGEKIIRCICDTVRKYGVEFATGTITKQKMLAWLEKQGNQPNKVSIWKHWKDGIAGSGDGEQIYLIKIGNTYNLSSCLSSECDYIKLSELDSLMLEKQGEQILANSAKTSKDEQKPAWSEEDEEMRKKLLFLMEEENSISSWEGCYEWLKSIMR